MQYPVFSRNIFHLGTALLCSIVCFPEIYSNHELLQNPAEIKSTHLKTEENPVGQNFPGTQNIHWLFYTFENLNNHRSYCCFGLKSIIFQSPIYIPTQYHLSSIICCLIINIFVHWMVVSNLQTFHLISVYVSIYKSIYLSINPFIYKHIYISIYLSISIYIYPYISIYLSIYPSIFQSIYISIYLSLLIPDFSLKPKNGPSISYLPLAQGQNTRFHR